MMRGLRLDSDTISSNITLDEAIASVETSIPTSTTGTSTDFSNEGAPIPPQERVLDSMDQGPASSQISELMKQIITPGGALPRQDFEMELYRIGSSILSQHGLSPEFLKVPANRQDIIATGLDSLLATAYRKPDPNVRSVEQVLELLISYDLLRVIDRANVFRLQTALAAPVPEAFRSWTPTVGQQESLGQALKEAVVHRGLKEYDREEWKILTRRFRIALALARETGKSPTEDEYTRFMRVCRKSGQYQELELALHHFLDHEGLPSEKMFREYIKGLTRQNRMEHAQEVFNSMKRRGIAPSVVTYGVLLEGYGRRLDFSRIKSLLRSLESAALAPTLVIYTSLMANYIRGGELDLARQVYDQLQQRDDLELDLQSQNVIANLMRLQRRQGERSLYSPWTPSPSSSALSGDVGGEVYTEDLNSVIAINHELIKVAESMDTIRFARKFKRLRDRGLRPNTTTFNILLNVLNRTGELEDGLKVLEHMKSTKEAQPDTVTFSTLLHGAVNQRKVELGWSLYDEMMGQSLLPTLETYSSLIKLVGLDPRSKFGRATVRRYFIPSEKPQIRYPVKASVEEQVGLNFATQLYNQLCNQGLKPNEHIFSALLNLTIRGGYMSLAQPVYLEMTRQNIQPNTAIMTTLIKGFEIQKDFESGWRVWRNMVETGIPRNVITYHHLIRLCERSLPNPMMLAELLENDGVMSESSSGEKKKRSRRRKNKEDNKASELLENTARIPLKIWTEVRNQMAMDQVHWDRVQQFRRKKVDKRVWRPIPKDVGPVRDASEVIGEDSRDVSMAASFDEYLNLFEKEASTEPRQDGHSPGGDETTTTIQEIYTGGGDQFVPKRGAIEPFRLQWNKETLSPTLKKDEAKRDQARKDLEIKKDSAFKVPDINDPRTIVDQSDSPVDQDGKKTKNRMSSKKRRRLAAQRQEQDQQQQPRPLEEHHLASGSL
ncbi:MAG: hypothetical protein BYD32DRAFT_440362 [Podila humilis]|nr:MAG: hypothetical protein BYD32DRAFT_440362 [Podila humilis]